MGYAKVSVTIPRELYEEIRDFSVKHDLKLSHVVSEALSDKVKKMREETLIGEINRIFDDPEVSEVQHRMAEAVAESTDLEEMPW